MTNAKPESKCAPCGGTGKVFTAEDIIPAPTVPDFRRPDCPECGGTGKVISHAAA
jgi:DnaJ-class molecular chaperone